ncbi:MAG: phosphoribosylformylglycinamidine synthase subunit PurS [Paracoccaceae bacterium]|jgi:phosphoribosylformylglycinamidine synthase|nr:phosphoribosylformylglycinamidine synthase subunit PurS [Paracoccaceae bacterium]|tara:strand:+ start:18 stop:260 length:243 start_codon:yes stop_codon:yes gene_type:complete
MKFTINITLKKGVLDPQGLAIKNSLTTSGFQNIIEVKQGKLIEVDIDEENYDNAKKVVSKMCDVLLANTVIEDYKIMLNQ